MRSIVCISLLLLLMPTAHAASLPGDSANGKSLYDANCTGCHDTSVLSDLLKYLNDEFYDFR